jgi:hypothetical protein
MGTIDTADMWKCFTVELTTDCLCCVCLHMPSLVAANRLMFILTFEEIFHAYILVLGQASAVFSQR